MGEVAVRVARGRDVEGDGVSDVHGWAGSEGGGGVACCDDVGLVRAIVSTYSVKLFVMDPVSIGLPGLVLPCHQTGILRLRPPHRTFPDH